MAYNTRGSIVKGGHTTESRCRLWRQNYEARPTECKSGNVAPSVTPRG